MKGNYLTNNKLQVLSEHSDHKHGNIVKHEPCCHLIESLFHFSEGEIKSLEIQQTLKN